MIQQLKAVKIDIIDGYGRFTSPHEIRVENGAGTHRSQPKPAQWQNLSAKSIAHHCA
jgi:hypothetical protein